MDFKSEKMSVMRMEHAWRWRSSREFVKRLLVGMGSLRTGVERDVECELQDHP
jgi:hypothetical protein